MLSDQPWCQDETCNSQADSTPPYSDYTGELVEKQTPRQPYDTSFTAVSKSAFGDGIPDLPGQVTPQYYTGNFYPHHTLTLTTPPQEINQATFYPCPSTSASARMYDTVETSYACSFFPSPPINQPGYDHGDDTTTEYTSYHPSSLVWSCHATTVESSSGTIHYQTPHVHPELEAEMELKPKTETGMETAETQQHHHQQQQHHPIAPFYSACTSIYPSPPQTDSTHSLNLNLPVLIPTTTNGPPQPGVSSLSQAKRRNLVSRQHCIHIDCCDANGHPTRFFTRQADLKRHIKSRHRATYMDCEVRNCDRRGTNGFTRRDHLVEHLRGYHMLPIEKRQRQRQRVASGGKNKTAVEQ